MFSIYFYLSILNLFISLVTWYTSWIGISETDVTEMVTPKCNVYKRMLKINKGCADTSPTTDWCVDYEYFFRCRRS